MNEILVEDLAYFCTFPLVTIIIHYFFNRCLGCRISKKNLIIIVYIIYCILSSALYLSPFPGYIVLLLNIILLIILSSFYTKKIMWHVVAVFFLVAVILLGDVITQAILNVFIDGDDTAIYIISLFLSKIVMLMLVNVAVRLCTSYGEGILSGWYWAFMILCPLMSMMSIYAISSYSELKNAPEVQFSLSIGLVFINYFIFMICDHILYNQSYEKKTHLLKQQINYYENQYQLAEKFQKETLRFRHDFKNILVGLEAELDSGRVSQGRVSIKNLIDNFSSSKGIIHSGNIAIDSIVNYKRQIAAEANISVDLDLQLPADIILDTTVISVIMGNGLDNAIEACKRISEERAHIKVQIHYQNQSLFICIENPYIGTIRTGINGRIHTTKSNEISHGIGLESIQEMVNKNNGILNISYTDGVFHLEVVLFNIVRKIEE